MKVSVERNWNHYFKHFDKVPDIYFHEEYLNLYADNETIPQCGIVQDGSDFLLFPFLRREVPDKPLFFDFETVYGYGGPIFNSDDPAFLAEAIAALKQKLKADNYIAGFIRCHPLEQNYELIKGETALNRETFGISLDFKDESELYASIKSKQRNTIRKASKSLRIEESTTENDLAIFGNHYRSSMQEKLVDDFYLFDDDYFKSFVNLDSRILWAYEDNKPISAALFIEGIDWAHYHLAWTDQDHKGKGAASLILFEAAKRFATEAKQILHLGGGSTKDINDSLLRFKKSFAGLNFEFYTASWVLNNEVYDEVCAEWEKRNTEKADQFKSICLKYRF